jgi:hypothetical protein
MLTQALMRVIGALAFTAALLVSGVSYTNPESEAERDFVSQPPADYEAIYWFLRPKLAEKFGIKQRPAAINKIPPYRSRDNDEGWAGAALRNQWYLWVEQARDMFILALPIRSIALLRRERGFQAATEHIAAKWTRSGSMRTCGRTLLLARK